MTRRLSVMAIPFALIACFIVSGGCQRQDPEPPRYDLPVVYDFLQRVPYAYREKPWSGLELGEASALPFLTQGWAHAPYRHRGEWFRWAEGKQATIRFLRFAPGALALSLEGYPYSRSWIDQKMEVLLNGRSISKLTLKRGDTPETYRVELPEKLLLEGENTVQLRFRYCSSRHHRAASFRRVTLDGPGATAAAANASTTGIRKEAEGWRQEPHTRFCWRMVVPQHGYLTVEPRFEGSTSPGTRCEVFLRLGAERKRLAVCSNSVANPLSVPLGRPEGERGVLEFEVHGTSAVEWRKAVVGGTINPQAANVLLFTIDSLRADHVGAYGYPRETTPFLDQLAQQGTRFRWAFTSSNRSVPSHATILTGRYPQSHGILSNRDELHSQQIPLARILSRNGHLTGAHVNWQLLSLTKRTGNGFEDRFFSHGVPQKVDLGDPANPYGSALRWVGLHWRKPMFVWIHSQYLHMVEFPEAYALRFVPPEHHELAKQLLADIRKEGTGTTFGALQEKPEALTPAVRTCLNAFYDANLRFTDDSIAAFCEAVKHYGLDPFNAVMVTSDHGMHLGEDGRLGHLGDLDDPLIHVPWIAAMPGTKSPTNHVVETIVETVDVAPTILSYLGVNIPRRMQGVDGMPLITDTPAPGQRAAYACIGKKGKYMGYALRTPEWLYYFNSEGVEYLIDVPNEKRHEAPVDAALETRRKELRMDLARWIDRTPVVSTEGTPISDEIREMLIKGGYLDDAE